MNEPGASRSTIGAMFGVAGITLSTGPYPEL